MFYPLGENSEKPKGGGIHPPLGGGIHPPLGFKLPSHTSEGEGREIIIVSLA